MRSPKMPAVQPALEMPKRDDKEIMVAEAAERERIRKMMGRGSTIMTGGEGFLGSTGGLLQKKSLLTNLGG